MNSSITSVGWYRIQPENLITDDRDGESLTTRDEVCTHFTDPSLPDTDCDGLTDGEEIVRATNPLIADTDGDGLVDGSDPEPLVATSLADIDCDGIADAYENYWFGDSNVCNTVTIRDETGFRLSFAPVVYEQRESESTLSSIIARAARELRKER